MKPITIDNEHLLLVAAAYAELEEQDVHKLVEDALRSKLIELNNDLFESFVKQFELQHEIAMKVKNVREKIPGWIDSYLSVREVMKFTLSMNGHLKESEK